MSVSENNEKKTKGKNVKRMETVKRFSITQQQNREGGEKKY